jgi:SAM-dependent methyltransferase
MRQTKSEWVNARDSEEFTGSSQYVLAKKKTARPRAKTQPDYGCPTVAERYHGGGSPMSAPINYCHSRNTHTLAAPRAVLPVIFERGMPSSVLDAGCGTGTWLRAAMELGVDDVVGLEGIVIPPHELLIPERSVLVQDFTGDWGLPRQFDLVICLEVAEHLDPRHAASLIRGLTRHGDAILFSAACPGQGGQGHVNCQWPEYWQALFNENGFVCDDWLRPRIWNDDLVEYWYRQNIFTAARNPAKAGGEPRLESRLHPARR